MSSRITINLQNGDKWFYLEQLSPFASLTDFSCSVGEYNDYLDALRSQTDHIALTWLLRERSGEWYSSGPVNSFSATVAYMSLIADAIKLSVSEKELHNLDYPFKTLPAMKIAKLAVAQSAQEKY